MKKFRNVYKSSVRKYDWKRTHGESRRGLENNIKLDIKEIGCSGVEWTQMVQDMDQCCFL